MTFIYDPPQAPYLTLLHADEHIIVVNKPSGLLSVPGRVEAHQDSIAYRVSRVYPEAGIVHRLDMATSGVMVLSRSKAAHQHLSYQFASRITQKRYYARLYGTPTSHSGVINIPLSVDYPNRPKQKVDWKSGKEAVTCFRVIQQEAHGVLVELHPITGRSHQLRMHMRELGTPILGDRLYSPPASVEAVDKLQLHAQCLQFVHPLTAQKMMYSAPIPFSDYQPKSLEETYGYAKDLLGATDKLE
ncbi:RNA pseudouridine synthase [Alteromonas sediminis]|uniref:Dual-specificity RNA pseudouridine synthase RluA n=2 Tax=Alteromonas sediminis TaxID=2259342 RepID=A0A3N5YB23_9ALTE|nr:pseudouridine synthase [Alteromonas sediminis]RPJ66125.1 RNA pseudouridine synthase [Alteromonas sediminis]